MTITRKIINIDETLCNGCGACIPSCPEQAIQMVETPDGPKARLVKELYCDGLGACLGHCPTGALTIEEREAEVYDDDATLERIKDVAPDMLETHRQHIAEHAAEFVASALAPEAAKAATTSGGFVCPSARMAQWDQPESVQTDTDATAPIHSELKQWPVQLHLVNPAAPYFKNADLYVVADCVPFAYGNFHQEFLQGTGKALAIGCPKLDDTGAYVEKMAQIITLGKPQSITIVNMEVPCCFGLVRLVEAALAAAGQNVPVKTVTISIKGDKLS